MCQLNVYCVDKNIPEETVKKCFLDNEQKVFYKINFINIKRYNKYNYYCIAGMGCNCGSLLCSLGHVKNKLSYMNYLKSVNAESLKDLLKTKALLENPDYKNIYKKYNKENAFLIREKNKYYKKIEALFNKKTKAILDNTDITQEEKESLLGKINKEQMQYYKEIESKPELKQINKKINQHFKKNKYIMQSIFYSLTKPSKIDDSCVCQSVNYQIEQLKNQEDINTKYLEYENYINDIKNLLKITDEVKIFAFWQDEDYYDDTIEKQTLQINDVKIDDIAFLKYKNILTITK